MTTRQTRKRGQLRDEGCMYIYRLQITLFNPPQSIPMLFPIAISEF